MMMLKPSILPLVLVAALVAILPTGAWTIPSLPHQRALSSGPDRQSCALVRPAAGPLLMARNGQGQQKEKEHTSAAAVASPQTEYDNGSTYWMQVQSYTSEMRNIGPQLLSCQLYSPKVVDPHGVLPDFMELLLDGAEFLELAREAADPKNKNVRAALSCESIANINRRHPSVLLVPLFPGEAENWVVLTFHHTAGPKSEASAYRQLDKSIDCLAAALKMVVRTSEDAAAVRRGCNWRDEHGRLSTLLSLPGLLTPFCTKYKDLTFIDNLSLQWFFKGPSCVSMVHVTRFHDTMDLFIRTAMSHTHESEKNDSFYLWAGVFEDREFRQTRRIVTLIFQIEHWPSPLHDNHDKTHFPSLEFIREDIERMGGRLELGFGGRRGSPTYARMCIDCYASG